MTGADLINWIQNHNAEEYEIIVYRDGYTDFLGSGLDDPDDEKIYIFNEELKLQLLLFDFL